MKKLEREVIDEKLNELDNWKVVDEKWLMKRYRFQTYLEGIAFVNKIAQLSEEENHHPFITIEYKLITVKLTSWRANGITQLDITLIEKYDQFYEKMNN